MFVIKLFYCKFCFSNKSCPFLYGAFTMKTTMKAGQDLLDMQENVQLPLIDELVLNRRAQGLRIRIRILN